MIRETYRSKEARNLRAKELKSQGLNVRRYSTGPCQLHPEYIKDWPHTYQTGFGNTDYLTIHSNLYIVEVKAMENKAKLIQEAINQMVIEIKQYAHGYQDSTHTSAKEYDELARTLISKATRIKDLSYELGREEVRS